MTAEERLQELYTDVARTEEFSRKHKWTDAIPLKVDRCGNVSITPEHIDLIANLVVERLAKELQADRDKVFDSLEATHSTEDD